ncbi:MAG: 30S ribosomal protein S12 methylthiotransferase RimO [bacterium]
MKNLNFYVETLGCPKNRVDMEVYVGKIIDSGGLVVQNPENADVIILNSCAFIQSARQETVDRFFELHSLRRDKNVKMVLTGCLPQLFPNIADELHEVDIVVGIDSIPHLHELLNISTEESSDIISRNPSFIMDFAETRVISLSPWTAYVKIADGCDNYCSYCSIPYIRGRYRERVSEDIIKEIKILVSRGIKEVVLISQETTTYGKNVNTDFAELLRKTDKIEGDFIIRVLYMYPSEITNKILIAMAECSKVVPYIDMPLQHVNDKVLSAMNRKYSRDDIEKLLLSVDRILGDEAILRTTFISGFPAEEKKHHLEMIEFIKGGHFDYMGVFPYSYEEKTEAARLYGSPDEDLIADRFAEVRNVAVENMEKRLERFPGKETKVLFEEIHEETFLASGRGLHQAPEIDGVTYITNVTSQKPGDILPVRIKQKDGVDFTAEIC